MFDQKGFTEVVIPYVRQEKSGISLAIGLDKTPVYEPLPIAANLRGFLSELSCHVPRTDSSLTVFYLAHRSQVVG